MTSSNLQVQMLGMKRARYADYASSSQAAGAAPKARRQRMSAEEKKLRRAVRRDVRRINWGHASGLANPLTVYAASQNVQGLGATDPDRLGRLKQIMGKGGYWGKRIGGFLGGLVGNRTFGARLGDAVGDAVGAVVPYGDLIANTAKTVFKGSGAYQMGVPSPSIYVGGPTESFQPASFSGHDVDRVRIKSREYLGAMQGSANFSLKTLILNPGLQQVFPQLSKLAMHYQQYKFHGLVFQYHSTSSDSVASANTALGEVLMANQPDSTEANPINKQEMCGLDGAKQAKPSVDQLHGIECAPPYSIMKYIRHGDPQEASQDAARFDLGKLHVAVEGCDAAVTRIGELWVAYDVELIRARDSRGQEVAACSAHVPQAQTNLLFTAGGVTQRYNSIGCTFSGSTITFPDFLVSGDYKITIALLGVATGGVAYQFRSPLTATANGVANATILSQYQSAARNAVGENSSDSSVTCVSTLVIRISSPNGLPASVTYAQTTDADPNRSAVWPAQGIGANTGYLICSISKVPQTNAGDF